MDKKYPKLHYDAPWPCVFPGDARTGSRTMHPAWRRVTPGRLVRRRRQGEAAFAGIPSMQKNQLFGAGYWTREQVAAVTDNWLMATVRFLAPAGVLAIRRVIPHGG